MIFGYCRVSTEEQVLDRQLESLKKYNCDEIFMEKITGTKANRPELNKLKEKVREEDIVVIESLSRLGRSTKNLLELVEYFKGKKVKLISTKENIDTESATGQLLLTVLSAISQFERDLTVERTKEGLVAARARGRKGGRPKSDEKALNKAIKLYQSKEYSIKEIVSMTGISQSTIYRNIK
jgi:DNA invertase Pin-like site-specific DNA recombinase